MGSSSRPEKAEQSDEERRLAERGARGFNEFATKYAPQIMRNAEQAQASQSERRDLREGAAEGTEAQMVRASTLNARAPGGMGGGAAVGGLSRAVGNAPRMTAEQITAGESAFERRGTAGLTQAVAQGRDALLTPGSQGTAGAGQLATQNEIHDMNRATARARERTSLIMGLGGMGVQAGLEQGWFQGGDGSSPEHASGSHAFADRLARNRGQ